MKSWDIYCQVVDNFGDIGVTWRLARQLSNEFDQQVRLIVDDLQVFRHLCPDINPNRQTQHIEGVEIVRWTPQLTLSPADIVIEAFGCSLPLALPDAMAARDPASIWINLEYLSAEDWVEDCHLLPSPQLKGPQKVFFFPGFTAKTGGLLRERALLDQRAQFDLLKQHQFLRELGVTRDNESTLISVFTYENPQIHSWLDALQESGRPYHLLIPPGRIQRNIERWLGIDQLISGAEFIRGQVRIQAIPFLSQRQYDQLLWSCDLNLVRGEDSFVRAQWAAKPFLWHIYPQDDEIHLQKLNAFLDRYLTGLNSDIANSIRQLWMDWNQQQPLQSSWSEYQNHRAALETHAMRWCNELSAHKTLAESLANFAQNW